MDFLKNIVLVVCFLVAGCAEPRICREQAVYETEVEFMARASLQSVAHLEAFIAKECVCEAGRFTTKACEETAKVVLVVKTRVPWHKAMMLRNAGIGEGPLEEPPPLPAVETLCPEGGK